MAILEADAQLDRRRLKRRLAFWRIAAVAALVVAALFAAHGPSATSGGTRIARLTISGLIDDGHEQIEALDRLRRDGSVKAVVLHLDTPGGAVAGGEGIHDAVAQLAAAKPVVAVMDGTAASAGYMIAVAAPHIVARASTLTGSIGVILETGDISALLDKIGVKIDPLVSGPLKGQPSFTAPLSPAGRDYLQGVVMDLYDQFVQIVASGRHMDPAQVRTLADGRAYTGRQALKLGLVDEIGGEGQAIAWLTSQRHVAAGLPVLNEEKHTRWEALLRSALPELFLQARNALRVDGAWSVWQPSF